MDRVIDDAIWRDTFPKKRDKIASEYIAFFLPSEVLMTTLKQIEALYWIAQLGSFERAASKLNTTQSAISKRVQDLEAKSPTPLFDRTKRSARLTPRGEQLLTLGKQILRLRDEVTAVIETDKPPKRRFRLGVTELTALTWLPRLVGELRSSLPAIELEPEVESSQTLVQRLQQGRIDMIVVPDVFREPWLNYVKVGSAENAWMCSPLMKLPRGTIRLEELADQTMLMQDERSGSGLFYTKWFEEQGITLSRTLSSNSLIALMGLTVSGLGVSYLPRAVADSLIQAGRLRIVASKPALPPVAYVAMTPRGEMPEDHQAMLACIRRCCDFRMSIHSDLHVHRSARTAGTGRRSK